ncbi:hypothetical protein I7V28_19085 [Lelliottia amnigena]|uniref:hypothetical protein n=1 Tax=Lelliottia TaxID=1330545 RepID=UPI00192AB784|nr:MULTISPECIES: hypothetical protein [Lelliottia]MBL5885615.1 hypothetical protein [Lelliottia aquatilis]MBL5923187.1 hypothetical protein [Lelliottia amnigena]MBL5932103.1 hypothetical protein [Lelliottia amnigena]
MKRTLIGFVLASVCSFQAHAGTSSDQQKVMDFCATTKIPLGVAAMQFTNLLANNTPPENARTEATQTMKSSSQYRQASAELKDVMDKNTYMATDSNAMLNHQKAMMDMGENMLSTIAMSWGIKSTESFLAWCNFNHLSS